MHQAEIPLVFLGLNLSQGGDREGGPEQDLISYLTSGTLPAALMAPQSIPRQGIMLLSPALHHPAALLSSSYSDTTLISNHPQSSFSRLDRSNCWYLLPYPLPFCREGRATGTSECDGEMGSTLGGGPGASACLNSCKTAEGWHWRMVCLWQYSHTIQTKRSSNSETL